MTNTIENSPLHVGDAALRFRIDWRGAPARPVIVGTRAVWVIAVNGERVTWTEGKSKRGGGGESRHTCHRRELLNLSALADELSRTNAPLPELAASELNPAAA